VRAFLETRLAACADSLRTAEADFQRIQEETGILVPEEQAKALVAGAVQIELSRKMREVDLGILRAQVGPSDPERARLGREIDLLEGQLTKSDEGAEGERSAYRIPLAKFPERAGAYARAFRNVKIQEALYEILSEQYEQYRILELRDTPTVQVLDPAVAAQRRYRPIRWLICTIATLLAFCFSVVLAWALDEADQMRRERPEDWIRLRRIGNAMKPRNWFAPGGDLPSP
jgi:capsule polysaccharide export protein KpsE/RkpR